MQVGHKMKKLRRRQFFDTQEFIEATQRRKRPLYNQLESHGYRLAEFSCWVETDSSPDKSWCIRQVDASR